MIDGRKMDGKVVFFIVLQSTFDKDPVKISLFSQQNMFVTL